MIRRIVFPLLVLFLIGCPPDSVAQNRKMVEVPQEKIMRLEYIKVIRKDSTEFDLPRLDVGTGWIVFTDRTTLFIPNAVSGHGGYTTGYSSWEIEERDAKTQ